MSLSTTASIISVRQLRKSYSLPASTGQERIHALDGMNLDVKEGEILGILGPNGAGKTTLLNCLATLILPDSGSIQILGYSLDQHHAPLIRSQINMSSGYPNYPWVMTVKENLVFYGRLYGLWGGELEKKIDEVMALFELTKYAHRRFDTLSSGTKQRLSLAKALLNDPKIVFLDEPTIGLDPDVALKTRAIVTDILKTRRVTVLLTTHNMDEVETMCDRVAFIKSGRILRVATIPELKEWHGSDDLEDVFVAMAQTPVKEHHDPSINIDLMVLSQDHSEAKQKTFLTNGDIPKNGLLSWLRRSYAFTVRNALFARRNLFVMTDVIFWPLINLLAIGFMSRFMMLQDNLMAFIISGAIAAGVLQITQLDVGYTVLYELWSKSLKHTVLSPCGVLEGVIGTWLTGMIRGAIVFTILSVCASWWFGYSFAPWFHSLIFLFGLFLCSLLMGMCVNMLILCFGQKVEITAWMFAHLFMIICGIYYPVDVLPTFWQGIAAWIPITYFLEFYRMNYGFASLHAWPLLKGFGLCAGYGFLAYLGLKASYRRARQQGVIIRLSE